VGSYRIQAQLILSFYTEHRGLETDMAPFISDGQGGLWDYNRRQSGIFELPDRSHLQVLIDIVEKFNGEMDHRFIQQILSSLHD